MLHPTLNVHVQYELKGPYLATMMDGMFISLLTALYIKLCLVTNGHLCMFNQALYPVDETKWCIDALFINDMQRIKDNYVLKTLDQTTNLAYSLDGYLWAISTLASEKLQVRCVMEVHVVTIHPPLQIVDIGNGCKAYSASIYIPAKSELTATMHSITRAQFFLDYDFSYTNVFNFIVWYKTNFVNLTKGEIESLKAKMLKLPTMSMDIFDIVWFVIVWYKTNFVNLTKGEIESLKAEMLKLPTMSMDIFDKTLENIDENYPFSLSPKLILALLIVTSICFIAFGILFIWYKRKTSLTSSMVGNLSKLIPSLTEKKPTLNSLLPILSELKFPANNQSKNIDTTMLFPKNHKLPLKNYHYLHWFLVFK